MDCSKCAGCPIEGWYKPYEPHTYKNAQFFVVVDRITTTGQKEDRDIPKGTRNMFIRHAQNEQFQPDQFAFHPHTLCAYDEAELTNKEQDNVRKHCRVHMLDAIEKYQPDAVLSMGAEATKQALGRNVQITKVRGLGQDDADGVDVVVMPVLHPGQALRFPEQEPFLASDMAAFGRLVDAGFDTKKAGDVQAGKYEVVMDLQKLIDMDPDDIAFDTETTGLDWFRKGLNVRSYNPKEHKGAGWFRPGFQILCMSFTVAPGNKSYIIPWDQPDFPMPESMKPRIRNQLRKLMCKPGRKITGHNLKFDNVALWMTEGIRFEIGGDSNVLASLYDENAMQKDLASMTKIHVPEIAGYSDWFDAKYDKSRMWEVPWEDMVPYVGGDTIAAYKLERALYNKVAEDAGNINYYHRVSLPGLNAFASIETRGMKVDDKVALPTFQAYLTEDVEKRRVALLEQIPGSIKRKHVAEYKGASDPLSLSRAGFMIDVLFEHPDGFQLTPQVFTKSTERLDSKRQVPSTSSKDHLPYFFDDEPFTRELAEYIKLNDLLNKSVNNFQMKYLVDGYVRPKYSISKTVTRRTSSMDPNGQNFPKRGQMAMTYQRMFTAPKGWYVISVDLSQAEIRVAGEMARDKVITQIYKQNGDIHVSTALIVAGITEEAFYKLHKTEQKLLRQKAKAVNFGFLYGMGWRKFIGYAKTDYGVEFTEREAKRIRDGFFKKYPGLANWHERTKKFVRAHKHVRSMSGLVRHLPMIDSPDEGTQASAERMAINSPVQEFASSIGVAALGRMEKEVNPYYLKMIGFIHDALVAYVRMQHVAWGMRTIKYYLENTPLEEWFGTKMNIPILAEPSFGLNMGEMIELPSFKMDEDFDFWNHPDMMDKDGKPILDVPPQEEPEDDGWRHDSPYTDWQYEEDEDVGDTAVVTRPRQVRSVEAAPAPRKVVMRKPKLQSIAQEETEALIKRVSRRRR